MNNRCIFIAFGGSWTSQARVPLQFKGLADELTRRGFTVVSIIQGKPDPELVNEENVYYWPSKRPTKFRDAFFFYKLVRKFKPSLIITQFAATNIMLLVGWIMKIPQRAVWYHTLSGQILKDWRSSSRKLGFLRFRKSLVYHFATNIAFVSKAALEDFSNTFFRPPQYTIFYNGMKSSGETFEYTTDLNHNVLCIARLESSKGQDVLIHAFRRIVDQVGDAKLILIGAGPNKEELQSIIRDIDLEESVFLVGEISPDDVLNRLKNAYMTVLPSRMDNCPLAIIESIGLGIPMVASNVGGIPEIIRDGVDGFLVPPEDPGVLAEKIIHLLKDPKLRNGMSANAFYRFQNYFELSKVINEQADWIEGING